MILESVLWFVSTSEVTCWLLMNEERKRMKALGGRGMYPEPFLPRGLGFSLAKASSSGGKIYAVAGWRGGGVSSVKVVGVTLGVNSMFCGVDSTRGAHLRSKWDCLKSEEERNADRV